MVQCIKGKGIDGEGASGQEVYVNGEIVIWLPYCWRERGIEMKHEVAGKYIFVADLFYRWQVAT